MTTETDEGPFRQQQNKENLKKAPENQILN